MDSTNSRRVRPKQQELLKSSLLYSMELLCDFLFMPSTPFFFYSFPPLHSVFLPVSFSPSLALSFLSSHPIHIFSLLVPTSMSCTLSPQILRNFPCLSYFLLDSLILSLLSCLSWVFVPFTLLHNHPSLFATNLSTSSLAYQFLWYYFLPRVFLLFSVLSLPFHPHFPHISHSRFRNC
jgi:hypothetical protein